MANEPNAVTQSAEQTAPAESAPVETKADVSQPQEETQVETPADASIEPEKKDSESVPYERFKQVNDELRTLKEQMYAPPAPAVGAPEIPQLEPDSNVAVRMAAREEYEAMKAQEFINKHPELKGDRVLSGTLNALIKEANQKGVYLDQEEALSQTKKLLEEKIKPVQKEANQEGFKEGQEIARKKEQLGAVGSSNYREPEVDDNNLTADEIAKKYNIPRI